MTQPETIAAETAARYGCPVMPGAVKIIPQGVSGIPYEVPGVPAPHWRDQVKAQYRVLRSQQARKARLEASARREAAKTQRPSGGDPIASTGHVEKHPRRVPKYTLRGKASFHGVVTRLAAEGKCAREIAAETGLSLGGVYNMANRLGLSLAPPKVEKRFLEISERDAGIHVAIAAGLTYFEIADQYGMTKNAVAKVVAGARKKGIMA